MRGSLERARWGRGRRGGGREEENAGKREGMCDRGVHEEARRDGRCCNSLFFLLLFHNVLLL